MPELVWTAIPRGIDQNGKPQLSVFASPRSGGDDVYVHYVDWPSALGTLQLTASFGKPAPTPAQTYPAPVTSFNEMKPYLWRMIFNGVTKFDRQTDYVAALGQNTLRSFDSKKVHDGLHAIYGKAFATIAGNGLTPKVVGVTNSFDDLYRFKDSVAATRSSADTAWPLPAPILSLEGRLKTAKKPETDLLPKVIDTAMRDLYRLSAVPSDLSENVINIVIGNSFRMHGLKVPSEFEYKLSQTPGDLDLEAFIYCYLFHKRLDGDQQLPNLRARRAENPDCPPSYERILSSLLNYPSLLRPLGLVFDVDTSSFAAEIGKHQAISVSAGDVPGYPSKSPQTNYDSSFRPAIGKTKSLIPENGCLPLGRGGFSLVTVDTDGAALKAFNFSTSRRAHPQRSIATSETEVAIPPSLRSGGIALVRSNRSDDIAQAIKRASDINQSNDVYAEDLISAYAVDLYAIPPGETTGQWFRLGRRKEDFQYKDDNGQAGTFPASPDTDAPIRFGVSRATDKLPSQSEAPRELSVHEYLLRWDGWSLGVPRQDPQIADPEPPECVSSLNFKPSFKIVGKLPPMRFGAQYKLRLRAMDLAGQVIPFKNAPDNSDVCSEIVTYRRYEPVPAPAVLLAEHLEIAEARGENSHQIVLRTHCAFGDTQESSSRYVAAPRGSFKVVEAHMPLGTNLTTGFTRARLECDGSIVLDEQHAKGSDGCVLEGNPIFIPGMPNQSIDIPYLPDPLARQALFVVRNELLQSTHRHYVNFRQSLGFYQNGPALYPWPNPRVLPLAVEAGDEDGRLTCSNCSGPDSDENSIQVTLPPGFIATVSISAAFGDDDEGARNLDNMALWAQYSRQVSVSDDVRKGAINGLHPMLSPSTTLTLVHAVPKPLAKPEVLQITTISRESTSFEFSLRYRFDRKSTGKLFTQASWTEQIDDVNREEPQDGLDGRPAPVPFNAEPDPDRLLIRDNQTAGDPAIRNNVESFPAGKDRGITQLFRDTKFRNVRYSLRATSRFKNYFVQPGRAAADDVSFSVTGDQADAFPVLSTGRPDKPDLLYIIPSYKWNATSGDHQITHSRSGSGLRVYMRRPWYSSGDDERIAVVVWSGHPAVVRSRAATEPVAIAEPAQLPPVIAPYVTQWGFDATREIPASGRSLSIEGDFLRVVGLSLSEVADPQNAPRVEALAYRPRYDPGRKLWYFDLGFDKVPGYGVFVRLALARFQENSVNGMELSPAVIADFCQLSVDRSVTISRAGSKRIKVQVRGPASPGPTTNALRVTLEKQCADLKSSWVFDQELKGDTVADEDDLLFTKVFELTPTCGHRRLVVWEHEILDVDGAGFNSAQPCQSGRLVYADVLDLF